MRKIAIQGNIGSFHEIAAHQYFGHEKLEVICCSTFERVFELMQEDSHLLGMIAIENTIAGSLLHNYELLRTSGVKVIGEHKLHIEHSICCLPDDDWSSLSEVHSHPVALMQCRQFLAQHPDLKAVEADDTAGSAEYIKKNNCKGWAAVCNSTAAKLNGMKILQDKIEDNKHNFTRFLVLADPYIVGNFPNSDQINKASLVFNVPHDEGSLSKVLTILSFYNINLTKIQSLPIIGHEWEYMFYVDVRFNDILKFHQSIDAIIPLTRELRILGEYQDGQQRNI